MSELVISAAGFTVQPLVDLRDGPCEIRWWYSRRESGKLQINRLREGPFHRPSKREPSPQRLPIDSKSDSPICHAQSNATKSNLACLRCISHLLIASCPVAVFWSVTPVVISTFDLMLWSWFCPHVRKEQRKVVPPLTDTNSPASISVIDIAFRIGAALAHGLPCFVFTCVQGVVARSVAVLNTRFALQASAGAIATIGKRVSRYLHNAPAVASTQPEHVKSFSVGALAEKADHGQSPKSLVNQILKLIGSWNGILWLEHLNLRDRFGVGRQVASTACRFAQS